MHFLTQKTILISYFYRESLYGYIKNTFTSFYSLRCTTEIYHGMFGIQNGMRRIYNSFRETKSSSVTLTSMGENYF